MEFEIEFYLFIIGTQYPQLHQNRRRFRVAWKSRVVLFPDWRISPFERHAYQSRRQITNQKYSLPFSQRMCQPFGEDNDYDKYLITFQRWILMIKTRCNKSLYTLTKKEIIPPPQKISILVVGEKPSFKERNEDQN